MNISYNHFDISKQIKLEVNRILKLEEFKNFNFIQINFENGKQHRNVSNLQEYQIIN